MPSSGSDNIDRTTILAIILASYLMIVVDISIVITGLPKIRETLAFSPTELSWVQNAYTLAFGGLLLLGARGGDILGRRRMAGLALFTAASLAVGLAQSPSSLIAARAVQGIGAAILAHSTLALLTTYFREGTERTRALAYYAAVAGAGASMGLVLGGMLGFWFFTTQYLQGVIGYRPLLAGLAFLATTLPNFAAAMTVPKLTRRFGNGPVLLVGLTLTVLGMLWLSRAGADTTFLAGAALPMVLIGIGQGLVLGPLTVAGVAGVASADAGAASGVVNVAHQLGGSVGLGLLVVVFASAGAGTLEGTALLAHRIGTALAAGSAMLALALVLAFVFIVRTGKALRPSA